MRYQLDPERVVWREVDNEIVAVDLVNATYLSANPAAGVLWPLLAAGATPDEMVATILAEFDANEAQVRQDVMAFLQALVGDRLVHEGDD
jgi:hypothetical protein